MLQQPPCPGVRRSIQPNKLLHFAGIQLRRQPISKGTIIEGAEPELAETRPHQRRAQHKKLETAEFSINRYSKRLRRKWLRAVTLIDLLSIPFAVAAWSSFTKSLHGVGNLADESRQR